MSMCEHLPIFIQLISSMLFQGLAHLEGLDSAGAGISGGVPLGLVLAQAGEVNLQNTLEHE